MPGKVKVKIISGKNLPVMDRSSDTTDAYVEIKLGNTTYKTDVCRRTLNPHWNTDWYRFEVDDSELQDEPLQIRLMDHDTYSANDAIGKVYLNLNPLLLPVAGQLAIGDNNPHHEISGWIPVFDTMHGIRGEVNVTVKVELFSDFNRFRQSSCGVHFFYSPTIPQGYQAKIINGFVEELIVDDDPEYQWIDKIRTPRASNEARQTLFFKLSGELQRKIGVKALSLGGNAVIGYRQCFDLEGESGIVARGIGTAVTLMKSLNIHHLVVETKDENIENYLKFLGDGKSFSLCSKPLPHKFHFSFNMLNPQSLSHVLPTPLQIPKLAKRQYASLDSNLMPSISNPNISDGQTDIKLLLNQEDKRGKSAISRRFQKFKHSQKSLSKKMIALKAKINDSIGEESDDSQSATTDKRKLFKRTASDSSAMAEILARSVMRATTSLSCILEDQPAPPQSSNEDETMEKLEPIANLLTKSEFESGSLDEGTSDAQSCSSTDSSSSCSDYEFRDYNKANNDVETISNIITNVERLQRCLSREGLHKQYSLPAIPTKGFSLSSLDNLSQFESSDQSQEDILRSKKSLNESLLSVSSSASNLSQYDKLNLHPVLQERRSSDSYDSRTTRINKHRKLERFDEIDLEESTVPKSIATAETQASGTAINTPLETRVFERVDLIATSPTDLKVQEFKFPSDQADRKNIVIKNDAATCSKKAPHEVQPTIFNTALQTMLFERANIMGTPSSDSKEKEFLFPPARAQHILDHEPSQKEQNSIVNPALQTMIFERSNIMGAPPSDLEEKSCEVSPNIRDPKHNTLKHDSASNSRTEVQREPKTIVNTALRTMLFERANILGTPPSNSKVEAFEFPSVIQKRHVYDTKSEHVEEQLQIQAEPSIIDNSELQTMIFERSDIIRTPPNDTEELLHRCKQVPHDIQTEPNTIVNSALQTMLFERANLMGTPPNVKEESWEFSFDRDNITKHVPIKDSKKASHEIKSELLMGQKNELEKEKMESQVDSEGHESFARKLSRRFKTDFKCVEPHEPEPKGMVKTALQTMLIERAELLGSETVSTDSENHKSARSEQHKEERELQKEKIKSQEDKEDHNESFTRKLTRKFKTDSKFVEHHEHEPKGILNTALQTMLIERAEILGTEAVSADNEIHKAATSECEPRKKDPILKILEASESEFQEEKGNFKTDSKNMKHHGPEPKALVKTALQTMLIERADLLGTPDITSLENQVVLEPHDKLLTLRNQETSEHKPKLFERSNICTSAISRSNDNLEFNSLEAIGVNLATHLNDFNKTGSSPIQHSVEDINVIAPVQLENVNIEPNKMVKTAMQTMLLEKYNLLGTYTPPTSPTFKQTGTFTFDEVDSGRKAIPKSSSSASLREHKRQYETVLGMPFASLSSLMLDYEKDIKMRRPSFLSETRLDTPKIETLKVKGVRKKRFKFLQSKSSEPGKHSGMFQKFRMGSKKSLPDAIHHSELTKEHDQNILSRMFHPRHEDKSLKDEETQTSNELLNSPNPFQKPECNLTSNNLPKTKKTPPKPPSHKDLASGDFLAHSKTKSACITSHHSSPAQERQDQNGGERKDAHSPDPGVRISHSPVRVNYMVPLHRRSSDSDLSITPKGNSLTGSDKSMGNAAAYFMRNNYIRRGQMNQEHLDMLEYPFLTMTKFPPRFIIQIGGSISARSVKLLERILNVDEPESRDIWWSEIRMEIRSHARSLNCNAVLGYTELTSICDDVCVLSACGTAAIIDFNSSAGDDDNFSNVQLIHKNVERDKHVNGHQKTSHESPDHRVQSVYSCSVTHLPYDEKTVPLKSKVTKCPMCLKGKVPEVLIVTIEPPESVPSMGKGCFIESHVSRSLKDLRGETIAKEISDGLPFLEYELHRLLVNKLKIKGMNAIFSLKIRITVGEKLLVGVATGTAIYLSCLPSPDLPVLVTDKVSDEKLVADLQEMLNQTVKKNKEIYQIKDDNQNQKCLSDEDSDEEQASLDISCGNKDCCILEMDDPEDAEVLRLLMQEKVPDGFHVVSTESVPGLEDLEIVKNLQMFTQIYRAKLVPPYNLQKHFVRILQSVYFKLRRMVPCALCDLQFRIDVPEADEIQFCVIGMALGLGKKVKNVKAAIVPKKPEEDLIFKLDDDHPQDNFPTQISKSNPSSLKLRSHRSPSKYRPQSIKQRHIPYNERRHGVDITPLSYVPGGNIEQYLGNLNFFFIRETTSIREEGGLSGFIHSFITEVLAIVRSHVTALGGNALVAFFMTESVLNHNLHKNQGQCLINVGGDVVSVSYFKDDS